MAPETDTDADYRCADVASGLYHFELLGNEPLSALTSATFESWTSLGSADGQKPLSILATKFHFILAFQTRLVSVSRLSGRIVWEQPFDLVSGTSAGTCLITLLTPEL
jgi:hypothetical protein